MVAIKRFLLASLLATAAYAQDAELTNWKSGIDVVWGGTKGTDYYEEYFYYNKLIKDAKVVYIKSTTTITMTHNARNISFPNDTTIGINGLDGVPNSGDEGLFRYRMDRDMNTGLKWAAVYGVSTVLADLYTAPFTLGGITYTGGAPVVGTTGGTGTSTDRDLFYWRGILDNVGDEWHVLNYADDDKAFVQPQTSQVKQWASDGKSVLLVVNPKTPCLTTRITGTGQFYTTPPKANWTPKIVAQTTYIAPGTSGTVTIELRDINGNNVFYRINGGSYTNAGASTVTLTDSQFSSGSNTLEYYYNGNAAYTKTRTVVKNPTHPGLAETHGNFIWGDASGYTTVLSRITRNPYLAAYTSMQTSSSLNQHASFDAFVGLGKRGGVGGLRYNAFVAKTKGFTFTNSGESKSFGQYTLEMLLNNGRTQDPTCFEMSPSYNASANRELNAFGYYDAEGPRDTLFAYDLAIANWRDDQVTGGLTAINDYMVRDCLASFVYDGMKFAMGGEELPAPEMWGGARMLGAAIIAMGIPNYSNPVYGTSGFNPSIQTTYTYCPFVTTQLTWKQALFDSQTRTAYPEFTWNPGLSDNGPGAAQSIIHATASGKTNGDIAFSSGYYDYGHMVQWLSLWANMAKLYGAGKTDVRLEGSIQRTHDGVVLVQNSASPIFMPWILCLNSRWPGAAASATAAIQALPATDAKSDDKLVLAAAPYSFALYDDTYFGGATVPSAPTGLSASAVSSSSISVTWTNNAGATDGYKLERSAVAPGADPWLLIASPLAGATSYSDTGLMAATTYYYRLRAVNAVGDSTNSTTSQATTSSPPIGAGITVGTSALLITP